MGWALVGKEGDVFYHLDDPSGVDEEPVFYVKATLGENPQTSPKVGEMEVGVVVGRDAFTRWIESVGPRGSRIGTRMYEIAAAHACNRYGVPLMSGGLSKFSRAFWEKQLAKGRAKWLSIGRYSMGCPAPVDLSGWRRR